MFKNANDSELELMQIGGNAISTPIAESKELLNLKDTDKIVLRRTSNIKLYRGDPKSNAALWFPRASNLTETEFKTTWKDFRRDFLNEKNVFVISENSPFERFSIEVYESNSPIPKKETLYLTTLFVKDIVFYKQPSNDTEIPTEKWPGFSKVLYEDLDIFLKIKIAT